MTRLAYKIPSTKETPELRGLWEGPAWGQISPASVQHFRPESSSHHPKTEFKLQHDEAGLFGIFKVQDRYVRCLHTAFQSEVFTDSCVEIFLQPKKHLGYFNFEFNCGGALRAYFITDPTREAGTFKEYSILDEGANHRIQRFHSLLEVPEPEEDKDITWFLEFHIPFDVLEKHAGPLEQPRLWRGNLYKCADESSHPHWAAWSPVSELNFHKPADFGDLHFEK